MSEGLNLVSARQNGFKTEKNPFSLLQLLKTKKIQS